ETDKALLIWSHLVDTDAVVASLGEFVERRDVPGGIGATDHRSGNICLTDARDRFSEIGGQRQFQTQGAEGGIQPPAVGGATCLRGIRCPTDGDFTIPWLALTPRLL